MTFAKNSPFAKGVTDTVRKIVQKNLFRSLASLNKPTEVKAPSKSGEKSAGGKNPWVDLKKRIHKGLVEEMDFKSGEDNDPKAKIILP